ncbi:unnamed protein product [Rotaria sp. Silwood2]|nr:unnamed protein product [Rotaria sp. Silwood2]CAF2679710.1 unnamed protein product [Rotaria sp. Silwood2]CAF2947615.1 unnamed protein product [Rotaria sp. Silwood2]CAF4108317.1 unnamed protein product [Rotaria sp. Silwood2]CAF4108673.1 unnamed protein product [Rotaria sp. Silwood2]
MTSNRIPLQTRDYANVSATDRLALSRAQHLQLREIRPKSISDDEIDAISDWSDSDRECCPLSDFETTSNNEKETDGNENHNRNKLLEEISHSNSPLLSRNRLHVTEIPYSIIDNSTTSTRISFTNEIEKSKEQITKNTSVNSVQLRKQSQQPLLPARRIETKQVSPRCPSTRSIITSQLLYTSRNNKKIMPNPTRVYLRRETTSTTISLNTNLTKDSAVSSIYSFQSHDENQNHRQIISPNLSQTSVPRAYEMKKIFVDDYDYGRLTDISSSRSSRPCSRQKWGTIVHPPFPLGYQHIAPEQITRAVERLSSPVRCRDRHTRLETPSKRYLSTGETDALVNRLNKVKTIRTPDQYWPVQEQSRTVKTLNNNWKGCGISA